MHLVLMVLHLIRQLDPSLFLIIQSLGDITIRRHLDTSRVASGRWAIHVDSFAVAAAALVWVVDCSDCYVCGANLG